MNDDVIFGLFLFAIGIFNIWYTRKHPAKEPDIFKYNLKSYIGSIGGIVGGLVFLFRAWLHR